jgi:hypothetical protein
MHRANTYHLVSQLKDQSVHSNYHTHQPRIKSLQKIKVNCKGLPPDFFNHHNHS